MLAPHSTQKPYVLYHTNINHTGKTFHEVSLNAHKRKRLLPTSKPNQQAVITEAEKAIFRNKCTKVADVLAYLDGGPTALSSIDDLGWVKTLRSVFEGPAPRHQEKGKASTMEKSGPRLNSVSSEGNEGDGFDTQEVYSMVQMARPRIDLNFTANDGTNELYRQE